LPYVIELADYGVEDALARDPGLRLGLNVAGGEITHGTVAAALGRAATSSDGVAGARLDRGRVGSRE
jgi:alanine dehydrogenase